ncbi:hypothetical protein [uncultured Sphaerochaeta sp.]|uniref:hypothetical protein n=1 Tax=uncultured Sphaerochaeta sp. TaxID=886478 RepID=UPI002A0A1BAF|nr:hypothetical protein [uncultured Sphaerochaeta sp.]
MSTLLFIPTYWSTESIPSWKIFDHPFPITEKGTLGRTLENLQDIGYTEPVMLLPIPCDPTIVQHVSKLCKDSCLNLTLFSDTDYTAMLDTFRKMDMAQEDMVLFDCNSYGGVRNIGLAYAAMHGFDQILMIDDDECIDKDYLACALSQLGEEHAGKRILGKTGCVKDENGCKVYDGQKGPWGIEWPKDELFNKEVQHSLDTPGRIVDCTVAFGGNMILSRDLFTLVPFDPLGTRGEDDDYVMNARYCGEDIFFDKELLLLHLPPTRSKAFWSRQRQDIIRFLYIREKIQALGIDRNKIGDFLQYFTGENLEKKAVDSSIAAALYFEHADSQEFQEFLNNAKISVAQDRKVWTGKAEHFKRMVPVWQHLMKTFS